MIAHQPEAAPPHPKTEVNGNLVTVYFQGAEAGHFIPIEMDDDPLADGKLGPSQNVNLEEENFQWLQSAAASAGWRGGSTAGRKAVKFFRLFFSHHKKLIRYRKTVFAMLNTLP